MTPAQLIRLARSRRVIGSRVDGVWRFHRAHVDRYFEEVVDRALLEECERRMASADESDSIPWEQVKAESDRLP
jgi:hypothetical protein